MASDTAIAIYRVGPDICKAVYLLPLDPATAAAHYHNHQLIYLFLPLPLAAGHPLPWKQLKKTSGIKEEGKYNKRNVSTGLFSLRPSSSSSSSRAMCATHLNQAQSRNKRKCWLLQRTVYTLTFACVCAPMHYDSQTSQARALSSLFIFKFFNWVMLAILFQFFLLPFSPSSSFPFFF